MKVALVVSVPSRGAARFAWRWQPEDGTGGASETFQYFFECCEDARKAGYECKFAVHEDPPGKQSKRVPVARRARRA